MKWLGMLSLAIAFLAIPLGLISSIGVVMSLLALLLSGVSAISGRFKYVSLVFLITTISLFTLSVASTSWMDKQYESPYPYGAPPADWPEAKGAVERKKEALSDFLKLVSLPYGVTLACVFIGIWRRKERHSC